MITFNVPQQLRYFIRSHQRICYGSMFAASSQALKVLASDPRHIGGDLPGFFGVLHTWGRTLQYHPHIHYIVPGGALSQKDGRWHPSRLDFYVLIKALSKIFRAKFRHQMQRHGLLDQLSPEIWQMDWNVKIQAVGSSAQSIGYLSPYVFKVAISNNRIVKLQDRKVYFRYKKLQKRTLASHVPGCHRIYPTLSSACAAYGFYEGALFFLNPNCSVSLE